MKIQAFKNRFNELTLSQQNTTINELEKANVNDHLFNVTESKKEETKDAFFDLIEWCKKNKLKK